MNPLGDRLETLVSAAVGHFDPLPVHELVGAARRRRTRRRIAAITAPLAAVAAVVTAVAWDRGGSTLQVTTRPSPITAPIGPPPVAAIAAVSAKASAAVPGPPAALVEVVGSTTSAAEGLLEGPTTPNGAIGKGTVSPQSTTTTTPPDLPDMSVWWVLITRHNACPPGCANASTPPTDYLSVFLRASDLRVLDVRSLGSQTRDLALAGPVYPLVLPGQTLPSSQPAVAQAVVPAATVEAADLKDEGCLVPAHLSGLRDAIPTGPGPIRCTSVTVRLYPNWAALGSSLPGVVEPGLAFSRPSNPLYYVTIWGQLPFVSKGLGKGPPAYVDHENGIYDATTGQGEGGGTVGEPLP